MEVDLEHTSGSGIQAAIFFLQSQPIYILYAFGVFVVLRFFKNRYASPLRHYPGPFLASGTRIWKLWVTWQTHQETAFINLHKKYGTSCSTITSLYLRSSLTHTLHLSFLPLFPRIRQANRYEPQTKLLLPPKAPSSASAPTSSPSRARPPRARSCRRARGSTRRPSTPSSRRPRTRTSSPRSASTCTRPRSASPARPTAWPPCRA